MNCSEFQRQLEQAVDAHGPTIEESAEFHEHLQQCDSGVCAEIWADQREFAGTLREWKLALPEVDLVDRVVRELSESVTTADRSRHVLPHLKAKYRMVQVPQSSPRGPSPTSLPASRRLWGTVASLAAILLMVSLLTLNQSDDLPFVTHEQANEHEVAIGPVPEVGGGENDPPPELVESYAAMPLNATEFVTDAVVLVVPADLADPGAAPSRAAIWADQLEKQLEPIGKELSSAFDLLLKAVPKSPTSST